MGIAPSVPVRRDTSPAFETCMKDKGLNKESFPIMCSLNYGHNPGKH